MSAAFRPFGHPSPMLDHLGDLQRHVSDGARFGFVVDLPKLNGRRLLHAGAVSTIADVVIGHSLAASTSPPTRFVTTALEVHLLGAGREGDWVDVTVTPVRVGRRLAVGTASFEVGDRRVGFATATFMPAASTPERQW